MSENGIEEMLLMERAKLETDLVMDFGPIMSHSSQYYKAIDI